MKTVLLSLCCLLLITFSCRKQDDRSLRGIYTETAPVAGRTQLNFVSGSVVVKSEKGSSTKDGYNYVINGGKIILLPIGSNGSSELDFQIENNRKFKIENLYVSIPEAPRTYMTFEK